LWLDVLLILAKNKVFGAVLEAVQLLVEYDLPYEATAVVFSAMIKQLNETNTISTYEFTKC